MRKFIYLIYIIGLLACEASREVSSISPVQWENRTLTYPLSDSLVSGTTYLSVYSQIYSQTDQSILDLTATVSLRNMSSTDSVFVLNADYFNTQGDHMRRYFDEPIFIRPMETIEIVIDEIDQEGGTGANFIFDWKTNPSTNDPFFEAVMISTLGQQGLSFTTQGIRIK